MIIARGVVRFALLGPLAGLDDSGNRMAAAGPRQRVLLAALLMSANSPVPPSVLAEAVWDGAPPPGAAGTLRSYVMRLRRALGPEAAERIRTSGLGYLISVAESELDVLQFERLCRETSSAVSARSWEHVSSTARHALGLWRGTPLADVPSSVLREGFAPRLEQLRVQLLEGRIEADLHLGRHDQLFQELRDLTTQHPLRERFHAQLMLALARGSRRSEALEAYRAARQVLSEELGIEPGPELREMQRKILTGDTDLTAPRIKPPGPGQAVVPRQLPASARHFTGRRAELDALTALLEPRALGGTVVISAINGMAGVGKTALAVHAAHRLSERFPDGQLFLDLHGHTDGCPPRSAADALDYFLRSLGVPPQQVPQDLEERAGLYRQRLAGSRTLILLDNAMREAQVRPLLPAAAGCLVVVTSRRRLKALDDAHSLPLDVLPESDAVDLFRAVAGPERVRVDDPFLKDITEHCAGLPLALRIAASLLRYRPSWSSQRMAAVLGNQQQRVTALNDGERDLGAVLDLSYAQLADDGRQLFDHLGLVPGPDFDACAAAALADTDLQTAQRLLEDLSDQNLLIEHAPDRFRLHDLVRLYACAHAKDTAPEQRQTALRRLLDYYLDTALAADRHLTRRTASFVPRVVPPPRHRPDLATREEAVAWMSAELANLTAAMRHSATGVSPLHSVALSAAMHGYLTTHGPWAQAVIVHTTAAEAARQLADTLGWATALGDLGRMKCLSGDHRGATQALEQALELSCALEDQLGQAVAFCELGRLRCLGDDFPGATRLLEQALGLYRDLGDRLGEARVLIALGLVRRLTADYPGARQAIEHALHLCRELDDRVGEATALTDLGRIRAQTGDYPGAAHAHEQALEICRHTGERLGQANALRDLGVLRRLTGDYPGAARALEDAVELYRVLGSQLGQANALNDLGLVYRLTGDLSRATDLHQEALQLYGVLGSQLGQANALNDLGLVRRLARDLLRAADAHRQALQLFQEVDDRQGQAEALNRYAAVLTATGDCAQALVHYAAALRIAREIASPLDQADALDGIGESHLGNGNVDNGITYLRQALAIYRQLGAPGASRIAARLAELGCEHPPSGAPAPGASGGADGSVP